MPTSAGSAGARPATRPHPPRAGRRPARGPRPRRGARAESHCTPGRPRDGMEQWRHADPELERFLHLWAMNRGILMTPFHNMALISPATTAADVDRHTEVFE